ncbi:MAG: phosphoenolpyruvate carboxykinase (ATP) [Nitrospinae bacterium]|nr:phosphoenolpyruvate carboxykinase (ATP) [Nitrospinota bacterium]
MSTISTTIDPQGHINVGSVIEAAAIQLFSSPHTRHGGINIAYELSCQQPNVLVTDALMSDVEGVGLFNTNNKVLVSITGQDTGRSPWARHVVDKRNPEEVDKVAKLIRNVVREMISLPMVAVECYFGRSKNAMGECDFLVPQKYAKHAFDFILNFVPASDEARRLYKESRPLGFKNIRVISHPDWVNPDWLAWKNRVNPHDAEAMKNDPEPPRIKMIFDPDHNIAFLLGNYYFGECKKGALSLIWSAFLSKGLGMPIHGSSKSLVMPDGKKVAFITIGLSGSGKSSLGNAYHEEFIQKGWLKDVELGNDDAIVVQMDADETSGLESGLYNKTDDYRPGSFWEKTVQSAENALVIVDERGHRKPYYMDVYAKNGRCITNRQHLPGAAPVRLDTPAPHYICTLQKDNTWGPIALIEDPLLQAALYITLSTKSTAAENISLAELGKLKISPGANPFGIWPHSQESDMFLRIVNRHKVKGLLLNTGGFFISEEAEKAGNETKIPKELSIILYPLVASGRIKWVEWDMVPGAKVPAPGSMEEFFPGYDKKFSVAPEHREAYKTLFHHRMKNRITWMEKNHIDAAMIEALKRAQG